MPGLRWERTVARLRSAYNYWLVTVRPDGAPHSVPVWGLWHGDKFVFCTERGSVKARNLEAEARVVVHGESADDAFIVDGVASVVGPGERFDAIDAAFAAKYVDASDGEPWSPSRDESETLVVYEVEPTAARAWLEGSFRHTRARWRFRDGRVID